MLKHKSAVKTFKRITLFVYHLIRWENFILLNHANTKEKKVVVFS